MIRVFAALFPSDEAKEHLVTALRPIRDFSRQEIRWTDPDNWHLTLAFYGDQPNDASAIRAHLAQIVAFHPPLNLHLAGAGAFENRTLWTGVGGDTDNLKTLMAESADPVQDVRPRQRAHLTIGRTGRRSRDPYAIPDIVRALSVYRGPDFTADKICLVESHLGQGRSGGSRYDILEEFTLR